MNNLETLTPQQLFEKVGLAVRTQANLRSLGKLPYTKIGRKVVYFASEIDEILKRNHISVNMKTM